MKQARLITIALLATMTVSALSAAQGSSPPAPHTGLATTSITLPQLTVTDANGTTRSISLGALVAQANNASAPVASLGLGGAQVLGATAPGWQIDTGSGPQSGNHDIALSTNPVSGDVGLVNYNVQADATTASSSYGALTATAATSPVGVQTDLGQHGVSASVTPDTSAGTLDVTVTGLQIRLGDLLPPGVLSALPLSGLVTIVNSLGLSLPSGASSLTQTLATLTSDLSGAASAADQLASARSTLAGLLSALPTTAAAQQALDAAQATLTSDLAALQTAQQQLATDTAALQSLQAQLSTLTANVTSAQQAVDVATTSVTSLTAQVNSLTAQINSLLGNPLNAALIASLTTQLNAAQTQLSAAQAQLTSAQAALAAAQAAVTPVQQQVNAATATMTTDQNIVTSLTQQVSTDQSAVTTAQQALDALVSSISNDPAVASAQAAVTQLTATLTSALSTVSSAIAGLPDLAALRSQLLAILTAAPLINVGTLGATLSSSADDGSGSGTITCTVSGVTVLGQSIPASSCDNLVSQFASVKNVVGSALDKLPVAGSVVPVLDGLSEATTLTTPAAGDTVTHGGASVSPLHLALPSAALVALADSSVAALGSALGTAQQSFTALGLPNLTSALSGSLGTLGGTVAALPSGSGLAGLHTLGLDASLLGLSTSAVHYRALATPPPTGPPATPGKSAGGGTGTSGGTGSGQLAHPGATPSTPTTPTTPSAPSTPSSTPRTSTSQHAPLPFTGDNSAADLAAALIVMIAGAHLLRVGRRRA